MGVLSLNGEEGRSVVVGVVSGTKLEASLKWWPDSSLNQEQKTTRQFKDFARSNFKANGLLLALDGSWLEWRRRIGGLA